MNDKLKEISDTMSKVDEKLSKKKVIPKPSKEESVFIDKTKQYRLIDSSRMVLQQHRSHADANFIETHGYRTATKILEQHRKLIIAGKSGQGKTYLAYQLMNKILKDDSNIRPLIISTIDGWRTLVDSSYTLGIIVDDMCGKFDLNEGELTKWREEAIFMSALIENGKHVVIFTMKSNLYLKILVAIQSKSNSSCPLFSDEILLNLDNICLQLTEKTEFARKYLKDFGLNEDEVSDLCNIRDSPVGFPQLCRAAAMIKGNSRLFDFFSNPREIILEQMKQFRQDDSMTYGCLVLVMLSGGKLNLQSIRDSENGSEKIENRVISVFRTCGIRDVTPIKVLDTLKSLQETYVSLDTAEESYSFVHDSIAEAVFMSYGEFFPKETLLYCPLELVCKCTSESIAITRKKNTLSLKPYYQTILINRFITALKGRNPKDFAIISEAYVWLCKDFRTSFIAKCKEIHILADNDENSLLVHAAIANNRDLVDELLHEFDQISGDMKKQAVQFLAKGAKASCAHKDTYLLKRICENCGVDANEILHSSVKQGSLDAIEFILQYGADVNYRAENGENLLHIACLYGRLDIVKLLLSRNANLVSEFDDVNRSVGHSAASGGSIEILNFLFSLGLDPTCTDSLGWNLLHYACWNAKKDIADHLMDTYPKLTFNETEDGFSVLLCAAFGGNINIFNKICELEKNGFKEVQNSTSDGNSTNVIRNLRRETIHQETLLHMSCLGGCNEMSTYLLETYPEMIQKVDSDNTSPAHYAAESGNLTILKFLIDRGADPWLRTSHKETLLHRACITGQFEVTKYLVDTYTKMNHKVDSSNRTPAHYAAESGNVAVLSYLIDCGTDPWCRTTENETLLHRACIDGQLKMTKYLVQTYPKLLHEVDNDRNTPAHYAAESGNVAVLKYLIDFGTDPLCRTSQEETLLHKACINGKLAVTKFLVETYPEMLHDMENSTKRTPAHYAAESGSVGVLRYLIDCGTNPLCRTSQNDTLLHKACRNGKLKMTKYLLQNYPKMLHEANICNRTPAHNAAESGCLAVLSYVIDLGADPFCRTSQEETLLHRACVNDRLEIPKYLVETYPEMLHEVDSEKRTAAHYAAHSGSVTVLKYLIKSGSNPYCRTSQEETLLHRACIKDQLIMTKYLVESFPGMVHEIDREKRTPAHYAAEKGNLSVLHHLVDHDTNPWCRTSHGETLLHRACRNGQSEMTKFLIQEYPQMLHEVDNYNRTPAHYAAQSGNVAVLSYLIECGTNPWFRTSQAETLLHRACVNGKLETTKYLVDTYPQMIHMVAIENRTPAHYAAMSDNVSVLRYVIDCGIDPWCRTSHKQTLMHFASINSQLRVTKYLLQTYPEMLHEVDRDKKTPAHNAAQRGNVAVLNYLIARGMNPWCRTANEETLLHRACRNGQLEMTKYLVESYPAMTFCVDSHKRTPAHYAAVGGNVAVLRYLIDCGTDPWRRNFQEETLLHRACINGQLEMTKYLIESYPNMLFEVDSERRTPAHYAAHSGNAALLKYVIDRGTDPWCQTSQKETLLHSACLADQLEVSNYLVETYPEMSHKVDSDNRTPAHYAAKSGNIAMLSNLIARGANPWCRTSQQETLLHSACNNGQLEMIKYLAETYPEMLNEVDSCERTPAHYAAQNGNIPVLKFLLDRGIDPWCRSTQKETLLHRSCVNGQLEMTHYLVNTFPGMLHEVDDERTTAAHYAAQGGNVAVLKYVIDCGIDPRCRTSEKETLLHSSSVTHQLEITKYLVRTYPEMIHAVDIEKRTPAHYAAQRGNMTVLTYLIAHGLNPWCRTSHKETLLHRACRNGQLEMTKYLVETYPEMLYQEDCLGETAAHEAAHSGSIAVLRYLIDCGIDPRHRGADGTTLLHKAIMNGQDEMKNYLVETYPEMLHEVDSYQKTPMENVIERRRKKKRCKVM